MNKGIENLAGIKEEIFMKTKAEKNIFDLWTETRLEGIEDNYALTGKTNTKEIAADIRSHLRGKFPMCKFSVRSNYHEITVELLQSPFEKDGDEVEAIVDYVTKYVESYNYDKSDVMIDYFDSNFYFFGGRNIVSWKYSQKEWTSDVGAISDLFFEKKSEWEKSEAIRKEKELEERMKQAEIDRQKSIEAAEKRKRDIAEIESGVIVEDCKKPYFLHGLMDAGIKCSTIDEVKETLREENFALIKAQITREVHMSRELYEKFSNMLLESFTFLKEKGGSETRDNRIKTFFDYEKMDVAERETVEWFSCNCVAILCEENLMLVCNPEGYDYSRYTYIPAENFELTLDYEPEQPVSREELDRNEEIASDIAKKSEEIMASEGIVENWNSSSFNLWRRKIRAYIKDNHIDFSADIIRALSEKDVKLKEALYRLLEEPEDVQEQFKEAQITQGQLLTIIEMDKVLGFVRANKVIYENHENIELYGGKRGVCLTVGLERARGLYACKISSDCIIVPSWINLPKELFYENVEGSMLEKTVYYSFDKKQLDVVLDYLKSRGVEPIINTYKPVF